MAGGPRARQRSHGWAHCCDARRHRSPALGSSSSSARLSPRFPRLHDRDPLPREAGTLCAFCVQMT